jgi:hypothetical protein
MPVLTEAQLSTPSRLSLRPDSRHSRQSLPRVQRFDRPSSRHDDNNGPVALFPSKSTRPSTTSFVPQYLRQTVSHRPGTTREKTVRPNSFYTNQKRSRP